MKKHIIIPLLALAMALGSCAMPNTTVRTVDDRPSLAIKGAPPTAILLVDGIPMGVANQYDGEPRTLTVEPGSHTVGIAIGNQIIFEQRVFVESSLKTITVH
jgi:PBP1b-binding outer membrane lipoprotein LpoB